MNKLNALLALSLLSAAACDRGLILEEGVFPPVEGFTATDPVRGTQIQLDWSNPDDARLTAVRLVRRVGEPPTSEADPEAVTLFEGLAESFVDAGRATGVELHYAVFAIFDSVDLAEPARAAATPTAPVAISWGAATTISRFGRDTNTLVGHNGGVCVEGDYEGGVALGDRDVVQIGGGAARFVGCVDATGAVDRLVSFSGTADISRPTTGLLSDVAAIRVASIVVANEVVYAGDGADRQEIAPVAAPRAFSFTAAAGGAVTALQIELTVAGGEPFAAAPTTGGAVVLSRITADTNLVAENETELAPAGPNQAYVVANVDAGNIDWTFTAQGGEFSFGAFEGRVKNLGNGFAIEAPLFGNATLDPGGGDVALTEDFFGSLLLVVLDAEGALQINSQIPSDGTVTLGHYDAASDGSFAASLGVQSDFTPFGASEPLTATAQTHFILKHDAAGALEWSARMAADDENAPVGVEQLAVTADGGVLAALTVAPGFELEGERFEDAIEDGDRLLSRFSATGEVEWSTVLRGGRAAALVVDADTAFILVLADDAAVPVRVAGVEVARASLAALFALDLL